MKSENLKEALEVIGQGVFDLFPDRDNNGKCLNEEERESVDKVYKFLDTALSSYVLVKWPECQNFMEEEWFDKESILALGSEDITGSSAYFIPIQRII